MLVKSSIISEKLFHKTVLVFPIHKKLLYQTLQKDLLFLTVVLMFWPFSYSAQGYKLIERK